MSNPTRGWFIEEMQDAACACGTMKQHWIKHTGRPWPVACSVVGCGGTATAAVRAMHATLEGVQVVPMCEGCLSRGGSFSLKEGTVTVVAEAACV